MKEHEIRKQAGRYRQEMHGSDKKKQIYLQHTPDRNPFHATRHNSPQCYWGQLFQPLQSSCWRGKESEGDQQLNSSVDATRGPVIQSVCL